MMFSTKSKVIFTTLFSALTLSTGALACSLDGWSSSSGSIALGQPFGASAPDINGVPRVEEFCALAVSDTGHVQTNAPSHARVRGRMYVYPDMMGTTDPSNVLVAYSAENGTGVLFTLAWDNGSWVVDATANGGGTGSTAATGNYDLFEFDWNPGSSTIDVYLNVDATTEAPTFSVASGGATTMESIRIGLPDGHGAGNSGNFYVDSVEMHNETAIGPLQIGDANGDGNVTPLDYFTVRDEILSTALGTGLPDCNLDAAVNPLDYFCIRDIILQ